MSKSVFKRTIIATVLVTLLAYILPAIVKPSISGRSVLSTNISADTQNRQNLTEGLSSQEKSDISEAVADSNNIDVNDMNEDTQQAFKQIVWNAAEDLDLPSSSDTNDAYTELLGLFDSSSENYNNLETTTNNLSNDIDENHKSSIDSISGNNVLAATHGALSVKVAGAVFNVIISAVTGGAIVSYVRRRGFSALAVALESRLAATLRTNHFGYLIKGAVKVIVNLANPGLYLAKLMDQHDKIKSNGWIEIW